MARNVALLWLAFAYCSCMEMRETVERTVMVRKTGSDLQPEATGYIYKRESDGPARVTKMGESEVIEQFSKLYNKPEAELDAAVPFYSKEKEENKAVPLDVVSRDSSSQSTDAHASALDASENDEKPVVEHQQDDHLIDGIANDEFEKLFEEYTKQLDYKNNFADYLQNQGHKDYGISEGGKEYGLKRYGVKGWHANRGHHKEGSDDDYLVGDHEGYFVLKGKDHKPDYRDDDDHARYYFHRRRHDEDEHDYRPSEGKAVGGYHEYKKSEDFYDGEAYKRAHYPYRGGLVHGAHANRGSQDSGHHQGYVEKGDHLGKEDEHDSEHSSEESDESGRYTHRDFGSKGQHDAGKGYNFEIEH